MRWAFADTNYYLAFFGPRDQYHGSAIAWSRTKDLHLTTSEFILVELGNTLTRGQDRVLFTDLNRMIRSDPKTELEPVSTELYSRAVNLFERRPDKSWSLTDCASFIIMDDRRLTDALTADQHFVQAGYRALLLESPDSA